MTELECMTEYSLVPVDSQSVGAIEETGVNRSSLYINDIQYFSSENIVVNIPQEINFTTTGDEKNFEINVNGYNVDPDYIQSIIDNQTLKPNQDDLNNLITYIVPLLIPGLVVILFIYFAFKLIKKIF